MNVERPPYEIGEHDEREASSAEPGPGPRSWRPPSCPSQPSLTAELSDRLGEELIEIAKMIGITAELTRSGR